MEIRTAATAISANFSPRRRVTQFSAPGEKRSAIVSLARGGPRELGRQRKPARELAHFFTDAIQRRFLGAILQRFSNQIGNLEHFFFFHSACRYSRCADADAAGF